MSPEPQTLLAGAALTLAFFALGLGPALILHRWARVPAAFIGPLTAACSAFAAYAIFWIVVLAPGLRPHAVAAVLVANVALAAWRRRELVRLVRTGRAWSLPCAAALVSVFYLGILFSAGISPNERFAWQLPADNILPALFAQRVVDGAALETPAPPLWPRGEQASERPPLQAALVVALGPFMRGTTVPGYQIAATIAQVQWVQALLLLCLVCGLTRWQTLVALVACVLSGFFFVNSVFTWPKLLSAWLFLVALATVLQAARSGPVDSRRQAVLAGGLVALSLLAHPGALISVAGLALLLWVPAFRRVLRPTSVAGAAVVAALLFAPWLVYQQRVDPPANRVARIHLAGHSREEPRGLVRAVGDAYAAAPLRALALARVRNLVAQFWSDDVYRGLRTRAQQLQFFHHVPALGLLAIGLVLLATRPRPDGERDIGWLAGLAAVSLVLWIAAMFEGGAAVVHHGSYANTALFFLLGAVGLTRLPLAWTAGALLLHGALFAAIWVPAFAPAGTPGPAWGEATAALIALVAVIALVGRGGASIGLPDVPGASRPSVLGARRPPGVSP